MVDEAGKDNTGSYGNEVLYRMCLDQPKHTDVDVDIIASKIWLIGRAYSATIERKASEKFEEGKNFCWDIVAPAVRAEPIDEWIASVSSVDRLTVENVALSLSCHKKVTDLFKRITGIEKRSLASKYLHFHAPNAFFIYDSIANKRVREEIQNLRYPKNRLQGYDDSYADFSTRCIFYRDEVLERKLNVPVTPRRLDMALLGYGIPFILNQN
jgi:hypothetical protein